VKVPSAKLPVCAHREGRAKKTRFAMVDSFALSAAFVRTRDDARRNFARQLQVVDEVAR